jgi:nucleoside-diphosphate-sugar epimerase
MTDTTNTARRNILVLGATGGTGRHIVAQALAQGHAVTALVRSPDKAGDLAGATRLASTALILHRLDGVAGTRDVLEKRRSERRPRPRSGHSNRFKPLLGSGRLFSCRRSKL